MLKLQVDNLAWPLFIWSERSTVAEINRSGTICKAVLFPWHLLHFLTAFEGKVDRQITFNERTLGFCLRLIYYLLSLACDLCLHEPACDSCGILTSHYLPVFSFLICSFHLVFMDVWEVHVWFSAKQPVQNVMWYHNNDRSVWKCHTSFRKMTIFLEHLSLDWTFCQKQLSCPLYLQTLAQPPTYTCLFHKHTQ